MGPQSQYTRSNIHTLRFHIGHTESSSSSLPAVQVLEILVRMSFLFDYIKSREALQSNLL